MFSKSTIAFAFAALLLPATPAIAQAIAIGMPVTDSSGAAVGTVAGINGDNVIVKTDKYEAALPKTSFTAANGKLLFGMTQAQLDAEIAKNEAAANASVKAGASVKGAAGTTIGTIESADANWVTIAVDPTHKLQVPRSGVRGNPDGTVTVGLTAEQVKAELQKGAAPASATPAPAPSASATASPGK